MRGVPVAQRRARLAWRHRLTPGRRAAGPVEVAADLVALHGTDPTSVYVSAWARMTGGGVAEIEQALYEDRTLIRLLAMRRTVFVTTLEGAAVLQAACSRSVAARERRKLLGLLLDSGVGGPGEADVERWLAATEEVAERALRARGETTATELAGDDPRLSAQVVLARGKHYEGRQSVASRLLLLMAAEGRAVRARPRGSWTSHQYRWSPMTRWCPAGIAELPAEEAEKELARRWLYAFGPAPATDLQWWAGWTRTQTRRALAGLDTVEVDLDGCTGLLLAEDQEEVAEVEPWAALLPALDPTPMGWHDREWFLGPHGHRLFDRAGNIGPSVWWNGRVVGGWSQNADGEIVHAFLEDVGGEARAAVAAETERLARRLGPTRLAVRGRGRSPLEEELAGGGPQG
ncbi:winged helix DNA-binding domain-containing protein [Streptomyces sp. NPDC059740]|uniref:winged helix DNA-binding domain-containing protein n=1 Tax=Streptomyces sp. NPDC059740 TaxID=3346926 RepID=UPI00364CA0B9